jgi:hypothetical protein
MKVVVVLPEWSPAELPALWPEELQESSPAESLT